MIDLTPPSYEQTVDAIAKCDISRADIRIAYADYLQSDEVTITDLGALTDTKLRCLKSSVHLFYILTIVDEAQRAAFYEFSEREDRPIQKKEALDWLRLNGLLDRAPYFEPRHDVEAFAVALETACGLKPNSALMLHGTSLITVRPDFVSSKDFEKSARSLECLSRMFAASDASENGIRFGFIGNEAYVEEQK